VRESRSHECRAEPGKVREGDLQEFWTESNNVQIFMIFLRPSTKILA
jgi:hypothetical protein